MTRKQFILLTRGAILLGSLTAGSVCARFLKTSEIGHGQIAPFSVLNTGNSEAVQTVHPAAIIAPFFDMVEEYRADRLAQGASQNVIAALFNLKPSQFADALEEIQGETVSDDTMFRALFARWAEVNPEEALHVAASIQSSRRQSIAHYEIWGAWAAIDPETALENLNGPLSDGQLKTAKRAYWHKLAGASPERALAMAATISNPDERLERENEINEQHAFSNPSAALDWLLSNRSGNALKEATAEVFWGWGLRDPQKGLSELLDLPEYLHTDRAFRRLAGGATRRSLDEALRLLPEVPKANRSAFIAEAISQEVSNNNSPEKAAGLAESLSDGGIKNRAYGELAREWANLDATQASEWVAALPASSARDHAASSLSSYLKRSDPEAAATWASFIDEPSMRRTRIAHTVEDWLKLDHDSAVAWLETTNGIPEHEKLKLLENR